MCMKIVADVAKKENITPALLKKRIAEGTCVITYNNKKTLQRPCAIGKGLSTKINVNLGTSPDKNDLKTELKKLKKLK